MLDGITELATPENMEALDKGLSEMGPLPESSVASEAESASTPSQPVDMVKSEGDKPSTDSPKEGTPAAPEKPADKPIEKTPDSKEQSPEKPGDKLSKFAKDAQRRDTSWKALNSEKDALKTERERFKAEQEEFSRQRKQWEVERAKASRPHPPEKYDQLAQQCYQQSQQLRLQADGMDKRADKLEEDGNLTEAAKARQDAENLRNDSIYQERLSRQALSQAQYLRQNPDQTLEKASQQKEAELKKITVDAASAFPDLLKEGSEFQKSVALHEADLKANGYDVREYPILRGAVCRLVAAEAEAARVPGLAKKLEAAEARVKELEAKTAPGGGTNSVPRHPREQSFHEMSLEQQANALESQAPGQFFVR